MKLNLFFSCKSTLQTKFSYTVTTLWNRIVLALLQKREKDIKKNFNTFQYLKNFLNGGIIQNAKWM